jgi:DNA replication protein DnaC
MRKLHRVELLVVDDLALHRLEATESGDFYELIIERHRTAAEAGAAGWVQYWSSLVTA